MVEGHGYDKITKGFLTKTYYFKARDPPHSEHSSLLTIRVWENSSIAPQGEIEMTQSVLDGCCVWDASAPSKADLIRKLIDGLIAAPMAV